MPTRQVKWPLAVLGTMGLLIYLAEAAPREANPPPDADLLEFLGSWHTDGDQWVDLFQEDDPPVLETHEPASTPSRDVHDRSGTKRLDREPSTNQTQPTSQRPRRNVTP